MCAGLVVWAVFSRSGDPWALTLLDAVGVALAMLGPGAWSIDALPFGMKTHDSLVGTAIDELAAGANSRFHTSVGLSDLF